MAVIPEDKIAGILSAMGSNDMDIRMAALTEGKKIFTNHFANCESIEDFAKQASSLEMAYNLVRHGLKKEAIRLTDVQKKERAEAKKAAKAAEPKPKTKAKKGGSSPLDYLQKNGIDLATLLKGK